MKKAVVEAGDKEILYSKTIKAGKRIYYLDVKKNLKDDWFLAITESKKVQSKNGTNVQFEKHKIFLYKEDFEKFMEGMTDVIAFIQKNKSDELLSDLMIDDPDEEPASEIKLDIDF